jgi:hypothetical protein
MPGKKPKYGSMVTYGSDAKAEIAVDARPFSYARELERQDPTPTYEFPDDRVEYKRRPDSLARRLFLGGRTDIPGVGPSYYMDLYRSTMGRGDPSGPDAISKALAEIDRKNREREEFDLRLQNLYMPGYYELGPGEYEPTRDSSERDLLLRYLQQLFMVRQSAPPHVA